MTDAPLLMIAEGRRPRPRKSPQARPKEIGLHISVAGLLRAHARPEWRWTHIPAGELRDAYTAAKMKAMGLTRGWPDIFLVSPEGVAHFLELKRIGGRLAEDQAAFQRWATIHGVAHVVADTVAGALDALRRWSALNDHALALAGGAHN